MNNKGTARYLYMYDNKLMTSRELWLASKRKISHKALTSRLARGMDYRDAATLAPGVHSKPANIAKACGTVIELTSKQKADLNIRDKITVLIEAQAKGDLPLPLKDVKARFKQYPAGKLGYVLIDGLVDSYIFMLDDTVLESICSYR